MASLTVVVYSLFGGPFDGGGAHVTAGSPLTLAWVSDPESPRGGTMRPNRGPGRELYERGTVTVNGRRIVGYVFARHRYRDCAACETLHPRFVDARPEGGEAVRVEVERCTGCGGHLGPVCPGA